MEMDKQSAEYSRVRKEMADTLADWYGHPLGYYSDYFYNKADEMLSIKGMAILSDDQNTPTYGFPVKWIEMGITEESLLDVFRFMLKANFKKVI